MDNNNIGINNGQSSMWRSFESGMHIIGVAILAFLFWPLLIPASTWTIIIIEAIWICIMIAGISMWKRNRRV